MGKKSTGNNSEGHEYKDDRKKNVKLDLIPEKFTKLNIFIVAAIGVLFLTTQFI